MDGGVQLVHSLVDRIPGFRETYEAHVFNEHGVLAHLFFIEVVQETVASFLGDEEFPDWRATLDFLEEEFERGDPEAATVIVTSFLGLLPYRDQPGAKLRRHLPPALKAQYRSMYPTEVVD